MAGQNHKTALKWRSNSCFDFFPEFPPLFLNRKTKNLNFSHPFLDLSSKLVLCISMKVVIIDLYWLRTVWLMTNLTKSWSNRVESVRVNVFANFRQFNTFVCFLSLILILIFFVRWMEVGCSKKKRGSPLL